MENTHFTLKINKYETQAFRTKSAGAAKTLMQNWYWKYDPLQIMPVMLALSTALSIVLSAPFIIVGAGAKTIVNLCFWFIQELALLQDNHTILTAQVPAPEEDETD